MNDSQLHMGHRERMREKLNEGGFRMLEDHEILEILLFYAIPRANTNNIAHLLLNEFGSLKAVFNADKQRLKQIKGIGDRSAIFLKLLGDVYYSLDRDKNAGKPSKKPFNDLYVAGEYLLKYYKGIKNEEICAVFLDENNMFIKFQSFASGNANSAYVDQRVIARAAAKYDAASVILAHNHPGGDTTPTKDDISYTDEMIDRLDAVGITLMEHIIIGNGVYHPMLRKRYFPVNADEFTEF